MTIEEKAKAYDEAIERAKNTIEVNQTIPDIIECVKSLFPELKESEDERIRKALIYHYQGDGCICTNEYRIDYKDIRTWLEKHGSEPNWCHHKVDLSDCSEEYRKAYYDGWNNCNQQHAQLEAEQKPTEVRTTGYWHVEDVEQKSWSEEDEAMLENIKEILTKQGFHQIQANWLKSLKDRVLPQPKWSEEDEQYLKDTLTLLEGNRSIHTYGEVKKWLKFLKERYSWKPSEEQMRVLDLAIKCGINRGTTEETTLVSLFNNLKKLREE